MAGWIMAERLIQVCEVNSAKSVLMFVSVEEARQGNQDWLTDLPMRDKTQVRMNLEPQQRRVDNKCRVR